MLLRKGLCIRPLWGFFNMLPNEHWKLKIYPKNNVFVPYGDFLMRKYGIEIVKKLGEYSSPMGIF